MRGSTSKCLVVPRGRNKCKNGDAGFLASGSQLLIYLPLREAEPCNPGFCMASSFPLDSARNGARGACRMEGACPRSLPVTLSSHPPPWAHCTHQATVVAFLWQQLNPFFPELTISRYPPSAGTQHQQELAISRYSASQVLSISRYPPSAVTHHRISSGAGARELVSASWSGVPLWGPL